MFIENMIVCVIGSIIAIILLFLFYKLLDKRKMENDTKLKFILFFFSLLYSTFLLSTAYTFEKNAEKVSNVSIFVEFTTLIAFSFLIINELFQPPLKKHFSNDKIVQNVNYKTINRKKRNRITYK